MGMFGEQDSQADFARAVKLVETVIESFQLKPDEARFQTTDGSTAWSLLRGSAEVLIFLNPARSEDHPNFIRVVAPIWRLPEEGSREAIYRKLLELNARELFGTAFGLMENDAVLVTERPTRDMDRSEVEEILQNIGGWADFYDDALVKEFGGQRLSDRTTSKQN